jgi:hypothetical protein
VRACSFARHSDWRQGCWCRKRATRLALRSGTGTIADLCPAVAFHARGSGTPGDAAGRGQGAAAYVPTRACGGSSPQQPVSPSLLGPLSSVKSGCRSMLLKHAEE